MRVEICMQDPTFVDTTYHLEAILAAARQALSWHGLYAFASRGGVNDLILDPIVQEFLMAGKELDLVVGIDAVTNQSALKRMQEFEQRFVNFRPHVFWNETAKLFHPKVSDFELENGGRTFIVGSGNLTPGGLQNNFEAYTVVSADEGDNMPLDVVREFTQRHAGDIRSIDDEALERAARNTGRPLSGPRRRPPAGAGPGSAQQQPPPNRVLLAQVPRAGGRWAQVHFNAHVIAAYFQLNQLDTQRVYLTRVYPNGTRGDVEVRPCVYSADSNKNHKIEIGAASDVPYPQNGRPLLVLLERQVRTFDYMLLLPGEDGYAPILDLSNQLPSPGKGFPRPVTDLVTLAQAWPDCPILDTMGDHQDF